MTTRKPGRYHSLKLGKPDAYAVPDGARETSGVAANGSSPHVPRRSGVARLSGAARRRPGKPLPEETTPDRAETGCAESNVVERSRLPASDCASTEGAEVAALAPAVPRRAPRALLSEGAPAAAAAWAAAEVGGTGDGRRRSSGADPRATVAATTAHHRRSVAAAWSLLNKNVTGCVGAAARARRTIIREG